MQSDDDTTPGSSGTPPEDSASSSQGADAGQWAPATPPPASPPPASPPPAGPWQPLPPTAWNAPAGSQWNPQGGQNPWQSPQPSAPPTWQPAPPPPPAPAWPGQSPWQPLPSSPAFGGYPPAGDVSGRRPSKAPQALVVIAACLIAFSGGLVTDHLAFPGTSSCPTAAPAAQSSSNTAAAVATCLAATPNGTIKGQDLYNEALAIVKKYYVGRANITDQQLLYGSIKGMVDSLGDTGHSTFLTPDEYTAWQASLSANVAGIGVMMSNNNGAFTIDRVIPGSPAEKAGVKAGDVITAVDGVDASTMTFDDMANKIRGAAGTSVTITVVHIGSTTPVDIKIVRANVQVPLADWGMVPGTHVADIVLTEFSQGAADDLWAKIQAATKAGATSIVLDLRGNPGGYASEAQEVASEFLTKGTVYIQQDANGNNTSIPVDTKRAHTDLPMVVLVDHNSASAAEIVAGSLQDNGRAKIVGVPTFGTGTVLQEFPLSDGSVIILGTAWWLTPNGHRIFGIGITPDQKVLMPTGVFPVYPTDLATMTYSGLVTYNDTQLIAGTTDLSH